MDRETVFIPEKKQKIEQIKKKYNNMELSDSAADKIIQLESTNNLLRTASIVAGIVTVINFIIPDPILGLDEIAMAAITGLFKSISSVIDNKIDALANSQDATLQLNEINKLSEQLTNVAASIKNSRGLNR